MENWYFFRAGGANQAGLNGKTIEGYSLFKINPVTKTTSFACLDPLCNHRIECPLFDDMTTGEFHIAGNFVFLPVGSVSESITGERIGGVKLIVYNLIDGNIRQIAEYNLGRLRIAGTIKNYLYYYIDQYSEDDNSIKYTVCRADAKTGNIIEIPLYEDYSFDETNLIKVNVPRISIIADDKIYWWTSDEKSIVYYMTDLDGSNKQSLDVGETDFLLRGIYHNGYVYYGDFKFPSDEGMQLSKYEIERIQRDLKLYRIPINGGEPEFIAEHVVAFQPLGDKIYYTVMQENPEYNEYKGEPVIINGRESWAYNWSGGRIYVMNSDGTDQQLLCETEYDLGDGYGYLFTSKSFIGAKTINGVDYIAMSFNTISQMPSYVEYDYVVSSDTIIINASTGELTVVSVPE